MDKGKGYIEFRDLPILGKLVVRRIDKAIGNFGLQATVRSVAEKTRTRIEACGISESTREVLAGKPGLLVANHPYEIEWLAVLDALPERSDIYVIGTSDFLGIGPHFSRHFIPVHIAEQVENGRQKLAIKVGRHFSFGPKLPTSEARRHNLAALTTAKEKLLQGGLVILFPQGTGSDKESWFSGLGRILRDVGAEGSDIYYIPAYVQGTSDFDFLRLVPFMRLFLPTLRVLFGQPQLVSQIIAKVGKEPRQVTDTLKAEYDSWVRSKLG